MEPRLTQTIQIGTKNEIQKKTIKSIILITYSSKREEWRLKLAFSSRFFAVRRREEEKVIMEMRTFFPFYLQRVKSVWLHLSDSSEILPSAASAFPIDLVLKTWIQLNLSFVSSAGSGTENSSKTDSLPIITRILLSPENQRSLHLRPRNLWVHILRPIRSDI